MRTEQLQACSTEELAQACAQQASKNSNISPKPDPCYELFCRAFDDPPDDDAWQAILRQYQRLVRYWLGQHADEDTVQEAFVRFWKALHKLPPPLSNHFPTTSAIMKYLKSCAVTECIEAYRKNKQQQLLQDRLRDAKQAELILARVRPDWEPAAYDLKQVVRSKLKNEQERTLFEEIYCHGLPAREIQVKHPVLFPDRQAVYRTKENLLKRLKRDKELRGWWANRPSDDE